MANIDDRSQGSKAKISISGVESTALANARNDFFARFETHDFSVQIKDVRSSLHPVQKVEICHEQVVELFQRVHIRKASGPDGICGRTLHFCAHQLGGIFQHLFQRSMDSLSIPAAWKLSTIVPVPKIVSARHLNDFRPVALTSLVMKVFETIIKALTLQATNNCLDPLQFAYQSKRSINDANLFILHTLLKHLENPQAHARLLFVDFSSAFNTTLLHYPS
ncbi:hypothetical protein C0Q70_18438 [Pomacea canaliculata]|uniref:Uncharacterized protein n=1 Tax=Pomacea canaliculata TaxID=400727 RepID=A0A2T7NN70_POMCA|nr:hypothetical protein C0Q70_18438 [Pomacea canaliculata]